MWCFICGSTDDVHDGGLGNIDILGPFVNEEEAKEMLEDHLTRCQWETDHTLVPLTRVGEEVNLDE